MSGKRIGERLSGLVPLSGHDIEEILSEQYSTGKRFGDIAIRMGLCNPEHVWAAWSSQLAESPQRVDLDRFAVDTQALAYVPVEVAKRYHIIPVRRLNDDLVIAVDEAAFPTITTELLGVLQEKLQYVLSNHGQIATAIRFYYRQAAAA
jgi:type IV pilus assembly protein PilB